MILHLLLEPPRLVHTPLDHPQAPHQRWVGSCFAESCAQPAAVLSEDTASTSESPHCHKHASAHFGTPDSQYPCTPASAHHGIRAWESKKLQKIENVNRGVYMI